MQADRSIQTSSDSDWRGAVAEVGRSSLMAGEPDTAAVIVAMDGRGIVSPASRVYVRNDYDDSRKLRAVVWGRVSRLCSEDTAGVAYYVVWRYHSILVTGDEEGRIVRRPEDTFIVYNGPDKHSPGGLRGAY